jgi:hypothetical protein
MAQKKLKKYPQKPRATSSAATIKNYFDKCNQVKKENDAITRENNEQKALATKLKNYTPGKGTVSIGKRRKKSAPAKKKTARRKRR